MNDYRAHGLLQPVDPTWLAPLKHTRTGDEFDLLANIRASYEAWQKQHPGSNPEPPPLPGSIDWTATLLEQIAEESDAPPTGRHAAMHETTAKYRPYDEGGPLAPPERTLMGDLGQLDNLTHQLSEALEKLTQRLGPVLASADRMPLPPEDIPELSPAQLAVSGITDRVRSLTDQIEWLTRSVRA